MISKIQHIISNSTVPYENMALEEYLMDTVSQDTCILYLWQNKRTVVIGKNQNPWQECKVKEIEEDNGYLARRLSGGGAVFHDLGNLNFTFLISKENYDVIRQTDVISKAVSSFGINVQRSGRNDLTVDGRKFSGNAFYKSGLNAYHHGTLLINVDMQNLSKYLNVQKDKLQSKGVASVVSRVVNLNELSPCITVEEMKKRLVGAFESVYGVTSEQIEETSPDKETIQKYTDKFASWDWRLGRKIPFNTEYSHRFSWGGLSVQLFVEGGLIKDATVFSDAMDSKLISKIPEAIKGLTYSSKIIAGTVKNIIDSETDTELGFDITSTIADDLFNYFTELGF